jgi:transcriptional regulator with XRE-family HTH domain
LSLRVVLDRPAGAGRPETMKVDPVVVRLRERREQLGLSQRAVAADVNVGHGHLSQIEAGVVDPKLSTLRRLADCLGVPL